MTNSVDRLFEVELAKYTGKKSLEFFPTEIEKFLPDYLGERQNNKNRQPKDRATDLSLEQQAAEFKAFADKLKAAQGRK